MGYSMFKNIGRFVREKKRSRESALKRNWELKKYNMLHSNGKYIANLEYEHYCAVFKIYRCWKTLDYENCFNKLTYTFKLSLC